MKLWHMNCVKAKMDKPIPNKRPLVAILSAHSPIALTVMRELGQHGVDVLALSSAARPITRYSRYCTHFLKVSGPPESWLPDVVHRYGVSHIMACSERDLIHLAALKPMVGQACILAPDADKLALVLDKQRTLDLAEKIGISVPKSWQPVAQDDFADIAAGLSYPVVLKWADPNAINTLLETADVAFEKAEYANNASELRPILERYRPLGAWPLVQSWCAGVGFGQMLNMHDGKATLTFQHQRLREYPPSGGVSTFCASVPLDQHQAQMEKSEALLKAIGWEGPAMCEYRYDAQAGIYWLMEINGRFWGSIPLARHAGAYFARESYACANGESVIPAKLYNKRARFVIPDARHIVMVARDGTLPIMTRVSRVIRFALDFLDPRVRYYVWSLSDPMPFFADMRNIVFKRAHSEKVQAETQPPMQSVSDISPDNQHSA